jgi:catechol 2,3-dioxygenase-like lactoylglutathione lyase family enzyme
MTQEIKFVMKLQVVMLPVSDIDDSIEFYRDKVGFNLDHDVNNNGMRIVQLTPEGSGCSIVIGTGMEESNQMQAGSIRGLHLVVNDIIGVLKHLTDNGIETSDMIEYAGGIKMSSFADPDGNTWALQELP